MNYFAFAVNVSKTQLDIEDYLTEQAKEMLPETETSEHREKRARREADRLVPEGCTCPNNGGGDCPWCVIYYDIVEGNVD